MLKQVVESEDKQGSWEHLSRAPGSMFVKVEMTSHEYEFRIEKLHACVRSNRFKSDSNIHVYAIGITGTPVSTCLIFVSLVSTKTSSLTK